MDCERILCFNYLFFMAIVIILRIKESYSVFFCVIDL